MLLTTSEFPAPYWGVILKSNGNGTYFGISIENVNRNDRGFVDFEKMINLDGIALINIVSNTGEASITGKKEIQSRITHNDGGTWKPITPPSVDSVGNAYGCTSTVSLSGPVASLLRLIMFFRPARCKSMVTRSATTLEQRTAAHQSLVSSWLSAMSARLLLHIPNPIRSSRAMQVSPGKKSTKTRTYGSSVIQDRY